MFPRHNGVATIPESFALNLIISVPLTKKNYLLYYNESFFFVFFLVKLIEYIFSAVTVCSNPFVGPLPRIKIYFFLLSRYGDKLIPTPNVIIFLPTPLPTKNSPLLSDPIPYPEHLHYQYHYF